MMKFKSLQCRDLRPVREECGLDLPDASLAQLDLVVAAVHSHFDLPRDQQMDRIMRAMDNRHVSILAHPTAA